MLINCPECNKEISNKAFACPGCGYPIAKTKRPAKTTKRMRLPNGFGSISEVRDHYIRKPFYARVACGKRQNGKPIYKSLKPVAYFETYNEAYAALVEYNRNPYDLNNNVTCNELFEQWMVIRSKELSPGSIRVITSTWSYAFILWDKPVREIKSTHVKHILEDQNITNTKGIAPTVGVRTQVKKLLNMLFDYAIECGLVDINESRKVKIPKYITKEVNDSRVHHISFTDEEMNSLWENINDDAVKLILIQCYSGWRPNELCTLETKNINLEENYMIGGSKTEAGKNRVVPIHPKIKSLIEHFYNKDSKYLVNMTYRIYYKKFKRALESTKISDNHKPHDCRKQFVTLAKKYNVDEYAIKRIVGHSIKDITESVYTDRSNEWLLNEISKIK